MLRGSIKKKLEHKIGKEITQKALKEYMRSRGYDNLNLLVYPPSINDIEVHPDMFKKVELKPFPKETDPTSNSIVIGWNLFVLGTNRMYLGATSHSSLSELQGGSQPKNTDNLEKTAGEIITFIISTLDSHEDGFRRHSMDPSTTQPGIPTNRPRIGPTQSGSYYERNKIS